MHEIGGQFNQAPHIPEVIQHLDVLMCIQQSKYFLQAPVHSAIGDHTSIYYIGTSTVRFFVNAGV